MTSSQATLADSAQGFPDLSNHACFEAFVLTYSSAVWRVCYSLLRDRFAAEDAWQETFLSAWRHRDRLEPNRGWLIKVATNKCLDALRSRNRHPAQALDAFSEKTIHFASHEPSPESVALDALTVAVLEQALARLPESQRAAFVLAEFHGWSYREIAEECGATLGTVKSRVFRARSSLRQLLAPEGYGKRGFASPALPVSGG